jgi:D-xylose 1-dehydrogenase (NADP+, D-xylono-1,5-lactone-forming)
MNSTLRWAIVGTGNIARQFAEAMPAAARGKLVAVASRSRESAERFATTHQIAVALAGYESLLRRDDVDAIYLSLPNSMHHEWTIRFLDAGKHVLCEKPLAATAREAREMFDAARRNRRTLIEAFMYRAHPQTQRIVDLVAGGAIGELKLIRTSFCFRVRNWQGNIRFDPQLQGGALMDVGCYCINLSRLLAGIAPTKITSVSRMHERGVDEQTTVAMRFGDHITAEFTCGMMVQTDNSALICGDEGYLVAGWPWKPQPPRTTMHIRRSIPPRQDNPSAIPQPPPTQEIVVENEVPLYALEADAFADCVLDGSVPFVSEQESIDNAGTIERIRSQIFSG